MLSRNIEVMMLEIFFWASGDKKIKKTSRRIEKCFHLTTEKNRDEWI